MKLAAISMIRDESDIIATFLRHLSALFDIVFLLDQRSSDGSGEAMRAACARHASWSYHHMDFAGFYQRELNNIFLPRAFERGADAVFFLDSDEFVGVASRPDLQAISSRLNEQKSIGILRWRPCVPQRFDTCLFDPSQPLWVAERNGRTPKAVIPRTVFERFPGMQVAAGNHDVIGRARVRSPRSEIGHLLHVPIRSRQQFLQKIFISVIANLAKNNQMTRESAHKRDLLTMIAERDLSDAALASIAAHFPPRGQIAWWNDIGEGEQHGFVRRTLDVPLSDIDIGQLPQPELNQIIARSLLEFVREDLTAAGASLELVGDSVRFGRTAERQT
jgi:hypothetical protein